MGCLELQDFPLIRTTKHDAFPTKYQNTLFAILGTILPTANKTHDNSALWWHTTSAAQLQYTRSTERNCLYYLLTEVDRIDTTGQVHEWRISKAFASETALSENGDRDN